MNLCDVLIINKSKNELPAYATEGSAGMDLRANLVEPVEIPTLKRKIIPTGIYIELPIGYEAQIRPRSGLAIKSGITVINTPGTIDSDYRGEIMICLINLSDESFTVENNDRVAQMIISKYEKITLNEVQELSDTVRGAQGFGHSGK